MTGSEYYTLTPPRLVDPGLLKTLKHSSQDGVVTPGGAVELDIHDDTFTLPDDANLDAGTEVTVEIQRGDVVCQTAEQREREREQRRQRQAAQEQERTEQRAQERREARKFWSQYDIPFEHDVAHKGRRSELQRGSTGTGLTSQSVTHLYVLEAFEAGRLQRDADRYLCSDDAKFRFTDGVRKQDDEGNEYRPPVTCQTCLDRMGRWKTGADDAEQ